MKSASQHIVRRFDTHNREISTVESKLIDMMLNGMGNPPLFLQCWDGSNFTHHPHAEVTVVQLKSRSALWRFLFHPEFALRPDAETKGIRLEDSEQFRQVMQTAKQSLPAETRMVNRLLGIDAGNSNL